MAESLSVKHQFLQIAERLPVDATWDDVLYEVSLIQAVEAGLMDSREGRTVSSEEVRRHLGLPD